MLRLIASLTIPFLLANSPTKHQLPIIQYQKLILGNVEKLHTYKEGMVFLTEVSKGVVFATVFGDVNYSFPCAARKEFKETILLVGRGSDDYYLLREEKYFLLKGDSFQRCLDHFGKNIFTKRKIIKRKKKLITLSDYKNLFNHEIYEIKVLKESRVEIIREAGLIPIDSTNCRQDEIPIQTATHIDYRKKERFFPIEVTLNLNWPLEFQIEKYFDVLTNRVEFTREKLPNADLKNLYEEIRDVDVELGTYNYPVTQWCYFNGVIPKKKWWEIMDWRKTKWPDEGRFSSDGR